MLDHTKQLKAGFELQRNSLEHGQRALQYIADFGRKEPRKRVLPHKQAIQKTAKPQQRVGEVALDSKNAQKSAQRKGVELQQKCIRNTLDVVKVSVPGEENNVTHFRATIGEQYDTLLESHDDLFTRVADNIVEGVTTVDEQNESYLNALSDQLERLSENTAMIEDEAVEAVDTHHTPISAK